MVTYPVFDSNGVLLGHYEWKDVISRFKDEWYLDKGAFYLKHPHVHEAIGAELESKETSDGRPSGVRTAPASTRKATPSSRKKKSQRANEGSVPTKSSSTHARAQSKGNSARVSKEAKGSTVRPAAVIKLADEDGRLCGFLSRAQLSKLILRYRLDGNVATLTTKPTPEQRREAVAHPPL